LRGLNQALLFLLILTLAITGEVGAAGGGLASLPTGACTLFCPISSYVKVRYVDLNTTLTGSQRVTRVEVGGQFEIYVEMWLKKTSSRAPMALLVIGSWSKNWPPDRRAYVKIYEGIPSSSGSIYPLRATMNAPRSPGNYSLWVLYVPPPQDPSADPVENLFRIWRETSNLTGKGPWDLPNCGLPHARIEVVARPRITYSNFWVSSYQVAPGETVKFGVRVNNVGTGEGTYEIEARLDGSHLQTKTGVLAAGQSKDLSWEVGLTQPGDHWIDVGGVFSAQIHVLEPGDLKVRNLRASASELKPGEKLKVYVTVYNEGEMERDIRLTLTVDGEAAASRSLVVNPMSSRDVQFEVTLDEPGVHSVKVGNLGPLKVRVLSPGECLLQGVTIPNGTVAPGDLVNLTATVTNPGDLDATCAVQLTVNETMRTTEVVRVPGGGTRNITLSFPTWEAGIYLVDVNGSRYTVEASQPGGLEEGPEGAVSWRLAAGVGASLAAVGGAAYLLKSRGGPRKNRRGLGGQRARRPKKRRTGGGRKRSGLRSV